MIIYIKLNGRIAIGTQAEADREMERIRQHRRLSATPAQLKAAQANADKYAE